MTGPADEQVDGPVVPEKESRSKFILESDFSANSLVGSWALYHSDDKTEQALVVAEPQAGVYLCEFYDIVTDEKREQRIKSLVDFSTDTTTEDGGGWRFYDDHESIRLAIAALFSAGAVVA